MYGCGTRASARLAGVVTRLGPGGAYCGWDSGELLHGLVYPYLHTSEIQNP